MQTSPVSPYAIAPQRWPIPPQPAFMPAVRDAKPVSRIKPDNTKARVFWGLSTLAGLVPLIYTAPARWIEKYPAVIRKYPIWVFVASTVATIGMGALGYLHDKVHPKPAPQKTGILSHFGGEISSRLVICSIGIDALLDPVSQIGKWGKVMLALATVANATAWYTFLKRQPPLTNANSR